jgi:ubiquinone/menaquinone biosynthesis C-methylase UbiE
MGSPRRHKGKQGNVQKYHDRVAGRYDAIYDDAYWRWHDLVTWEHIKRFLPRDLGVPVADLGCGTGKWGFKLLKSGFRVTFVDISIKMLEQARRKVEESGSSAKAEFLQADLSDPSPLPQERFGLMLGMGDPLSCVPSLQASLAGIARSLMPGGVVVATVDHMPAAIDYFIEQADVEGLTEFLRTGRTHWLTKQEQERFQTTQYTVDEVAGAVRKAGLELVEVIGKTVLPMRDHRGLLDDSEMARRLAEIERKLHHDTSMLGRCSHLQFVARRAAASLAAK